MTTYRKNAANLPSAATTTSFRNWIQDCVTMFGSIGLTKAADTGMLDETTVTWPGVVSTYAGYQIWYLDDSLHSTYPIYVRFGWGQGASSARMMWSWQIGYATNGTGSLTGYTQSGTMLLGTSSTSGTSNATGINCGSGGEGYSWFYNGRSSWTAAVNYQSTPFFCIQREHDVNGAVVNGGNFALFYQSPDAGMPFRVMAFNREFSTLFGPSQYYCLTPFNTTQSGSATETELWRHLTKFPAVGSLGATATYMSGDIQIDAPFTAEVTGAVRTWLPTGIAGCSVDPTNGSHMLAALWE